jgi:16S rRNA C967 or C1407 C5-methylase (RsmB/RsmF family)/NOL1/NOP2/fmu family ribosome biogenesis protein
MNRFRGYCEMFASPACRLTSAVATETPRHGGTRMDVVAHERVVNLKASMTTHKPELPNEFADQMQNLLGVEYNAFMEALAMSTPVSIRLNPRKGSTHIAGKPVLWCSNGLYLEQRPSFTLDPHFHGGAYYVQEASSMFVEQALLQSVDIKQPLRVLDLCAAPGGKSTHLVSLLAPGSLLISNDAIRSRAAILSENMQKWGHANVVVTNNDPVAFSGLGGFFDVILIDAPCSGEGMFRKDPQAIEEWSPEHVALCSSRQRRILEDAWPSLKEGGILIYCTCTYNQEENEANLERFRREHTFSFVSLKSSDGIQVVNGTVNGYRFFPHHVDGEGFFLSVIQKKEQAERSSQSRNKRKEPARKELPAWLKGDFVATQREDLIIAVPADVADDIDLLSQHLNVMTRGVALYTDKHGKLVPEHAAALCVDLDHDQFPTLDLNREQALNYLRKETIDITPGQKGFCLVRFEGTALGWVNALDRRINNLYPSNWRIRMQ